MAYWAEVTDHSGAAAQAVRDFVRPALEAVPPSLASRLGMCRVNLFPSLGGAGVTSRWSRSGNRLQIDLSVSSFEPHDLALELLMCIGQVVWESAAGQERAAWLKLLDGEISAGVEGEIDEETLEEKRRLLSSRALAASPRRLLRYAGAAFAATLAEYVHALWHDVTVRTGPEHLPPEWLRRRLALFERWFPPEGGRRLYPERHPP